MLIFKYIIVAIGIFFNGGMTMINNYNYQSDANIQCLLDDVEYSERKDAFLKITTEFEKHQVRWGLACSMNLFIRGVVDEFHDIDLLIEAKDVEKVTKIMDENGAELIATGGNGFCESDIYFHFQFGRIDVDIISGFRLVTFGTCFLYEFNEGELDFITIDRKKVPLISMEALYLLYSMMEGWQPRRRYKRILIEEYLLYNKIGYKEIFNRALKNFQLPGWIKRNILDMMSE